MQGYGDARGSTDAAAMNDREVQAESGHITSFGDQASRGAPDHGPPV
jgi:hypothetical protein